MSESSRPAAVPPDRFLLAIVLGAVGLIVLGIAAVLLVGRTPAPAAVDPASPVGVVQAYIEALRQGDIDRAHSFLTRSARDSLDKQPLPRAPYASSDQRRLLIEPIEVKSDRALVRVTIGAFSSRSEPFSTSSYNQEVDVRLIREDGQWRIVAPAEPFPFLY